MFIISVDNLCTYWVGVVNGLNWIGVTQVVDYFSTLYKVNNYVLMGSALLFQVYSSLLFWYKVDK